MNETIPDGFEQIEHHDHLDLHNEELGIVITIHENNSTHRDMHGSYRWKVIGSQDQKAFYEGAFQSLSHAEEKVLELAEKYA